MEKVKNFIIFKDVENNFVDQVLEKENQVAKDSFLRALKGSFTGNGIISGKPWAIYI